MDLNAALTVMKAQKEQTESQLRTKFVGKWLQGDHLSLSELRELGYSGPFARVILKEHPFWSTDDAIGQIKVAFGLHEKSYSSFLSCYGRFHASLVYEKVPDHEVVAAEITESIFRFVFSSSALVQAYRRFKSAAPDFANALDQTVEKVFENPGLKAFIQELRNCYGHSKIIQGNPRSTVRYREVREVESGIEFSKDEILSCRINSPAREFIKNSERLDALRIVSDYYKSSQRLHQIYLAETGVTEDEAFHELARCREAISAVSKVVSLGLLFQGAGKKTNPYAYLSSHFTDAELKRIFCHKARSKEQIDYMIHLRDPLGLCPDELRQKLHQLFGRVDSTDTST